MTTSLHASTNTSNTIYTRVESHNRLYQLQLWLGYESVDLARLSLNFLTRFSTTILGRSNENCDWHVFTISILEVRNSFMKNLFITKSNDFRSVLVNGQTSKPYSKTVVALLKSSISNTSSYRYRLHWRWNFAVCSIKSNGNQIIYKILLSKYYYNLSKLLMSVLFFRGFDKSVHNTYSNISN